ncbi:MAG: transglycosylase SLT domain-containing protein [Erythrobacter sp.]|nr:transglycosylase SLT domain-containing protein [Erythrobacter sp.]
MTHTASASGFPHGPQHAAATAAREAMASRRIEPGAARQIAGSQRASVEQAIADAARSTGVDFDFLLAQAQVESALDPAARARTSSASGLYQFIESTWLDVMKRHGPRFGMGEIAAQIAVTEGGIAKVADPRQRAAILALRNDPAVASLMAAGLAEDNSAHLAPILGRQPEAGELYLAHFLGAGGAGRFLSAMHADPHRSAADLFQRAAAANGAVFYDAGGAPRSLAGVMQFLDGKLQRALDHAPSMPAAGRFGPDFTALRAAGVPYLITAEEVFEPGIPARVTGGAQGQWPTRIEVDPTLSLPARPASPDPFPALPRRARSMSSLIGEGLRAAATTGQTSPHGAQHIRRAYDRLRAMGL